VRLRRKGEEGKDATPTTETQSETPVENGRPATPNVEL